MLGEYMQITYFSVENLKDGCVTDNLVPRFSFALASGEQNVALKEAVIEVNGCRMVTKDQVLVPLHGKPHGNAHQWRKRLRTGKVQYGQAWG